MLAMEWGGRRMVHDAVSELGQRIRLGQECLVYGQSDYTARVSSYLRMLLPSVNLIIMDFPLETDQPDRTTFDFSRYDAELRELPRDIVIYLAFSAKYHVLLRIKLELMGFLDIRLYDSVLDNSLKYLFWKKYCISIGKSFREIYDWPEIREETDSSVEIYQARCILDKQIDVYPKEISDKVIPIQVGAALTEKRIADVLDSTGDNISERNHRYSEMTAFYWMWKNAKADYLGICHYRRLWVDLERIVKKLRTTSVEAILPLPTLCEHSIHEDYLLKHIPDVWQTMMQVLKEHSPEYYEASTEIFQGKIFYASNMCILKREVLEDLCEWMFPIVMEIEHYIGDLPDPYYNRYAGFCTERLITLYFLYNKSDWTIAHAEKIFLASS